MYIKVYLSEQEKKQLEEIAERKKLSVSKLCYEQLAPLLSAPLTVPDNETKEPAQIKFNNRVPVYFSEKEYQALLSDAKGISLSSYVRKEFLSRREPVRILVYTDDISVLNNNTSSLHPFASLRTAPNPLIRTLHIHPYICGFS